MKTIIHIIPSLGYGGAEVLLARFIESTSSENVNHVVFSLVQTENQVIAPDNKNVFQFTVRETPVRSIFSMIKIAKDQHEVVFLGWLYVGCLFALILSLAVSSNAVFYIHHSLANLAVEKRHTRIIIWLLSHLTKLKVVTKVIYVSMLSKLQHEKIGYAQSKSSLIFNGVSIKSDRPSMANYRINKNKIVIGNFSRFHPVKDHELTFKLVKEILSLERDVEMHLAGEGVNPGNPELVDLLREYKLLDKAILHGTVDNIEPLYEKIDLYVLSSVAESLPNVILEAMNHGLIIASTNVGDVSAVLGSDFIEISSGDLNLTARKVIEEYDLGSLSGRESRFNDTLRSKFDQRRQFGALLEEVHG
jgi:glycosyltransferase involved in cell wall biosynthesis